MTVEKNPTPRNASGKTYQEQRDAIQFARNKVFDARAYLVSELAMMNEALHALDIRELNLAMEQSEAEGLGVNERRDKS